MILENWFSVPIWHGLYNIDFESAKNKIWELRESGYTNRIISNYGGWQSTDVPLSEYTELVDIEKCINDSIEKFSVQISPNFKARLDNSWINMNDPGNYNRRHSHPISTFSGCFYVEVPENSGEVIFYKEHSAIVHYPIRLDDDTDPMFYNFVTYRPQNGTILIFPSWIDHMVTENKSSQTRISIAFNIRQI